MAQGTEGCPQRTHSLILTTRMPSLVCSFPRKVCDPQRIKEAVAAPSGLGRVEHRPVHPEVASSGQGTT